MKISLIVLVVVAVASWQRVVEGQSLEEKLRMATNRLQEQLISKVVDKEQALAQEKTRIRDIEALIETRRDHNRNLTHAKREAPSCRQVVQDEKKGGALICSSSGVTCWGYPMSRFLDPQSFLAYSYTS